jgi:hypothetical protein
MAKSHINGGRDDADNEDELVIYVQIEWKQINFSKYCSLGRKNKS